MNRHPDLTETVEGEIYDWQFDSVGYDHGEKTVVQYSYNYEGSRSVAIKRLIEHLIGDLEVMARQGID